MRYVRSLQGLHDFIATVVVGAPDRFRYREHRTPEDQHDLERAFEELRAGLEFVEKSERARGFHDQLLATLDDSLQAYRVGEIKRGAHRLQDFQDMIFGSDGQPS